MWNESRLKPYEPSPFAGEIGAARPIPAGTIARGQYRPDDPINTGRSGGQLLATSPVPITPAVLARGQERYVAYCSPCHSRLGDGQGMVVQRGFPHPPDYAIPRLRQARIGHFYDVITNGYGVMYSYANRVPVKDRWALAAYIRVLQAARPVVQEDQYTFERERARERHIQDPNRPMRLEQEGPGVGTTMPAPLPGQHDPTRRGTDVEDPAAPHQ